MEPGDFGNLAEKIGVIGAAVAAVGGALWKFFSMIANRHFKFLDRLDVTLDKVETNLDKMSLNQERIAERLGRISNPKTKMVKRVNPDQAAG